MIHPLRVYVFLQLFDTTPQKAYIDVFDTECKWLCIYLYFLPPLFPLHSAAHDHAHCGEN